MQCKSIPLIFISLSLFSIAVSGQLQVTSPYARFNIGNLVPSASYKSLGMGGAGIGMKSGNSVFFANPASYSAIDTNSFVFDFGIDYGIVRLTDHKDHFKSDDMNFDHLIMAFPITKGFGFAVGVVPLSDGYYKLSESVLKTSPNYDPIVGEFLSVHNGDGGFNNLFLGTGLKITRKLSAGINMRMLFGQENRSYQVNFADYNNVYNNNAVEKLEMHGISFDYGLQYTTSLKKDYFITAGLSISPGKNYKTNYQQLSYKYTAYNTRDTISYTANDSTRTFLPATIGAGISVGKTNKFTASLDYVLTRWSAAKIPGPGNYTADSRSCRFGIEYIPDKYSNFGIFQRLEYRLGGHFGDSYLIINNDQIKEYGASFGLGVPLRRTYSRVNFYFDYTRKSGSGTDILHIEDFYTMGVSLNLHDFWFIKRRYD